MIKKATLAIAAALIAGSVSSSAFASAMDNDPTTGLWSQYYYGPIADLYKQGLPISPAAVAYMKQHGVATKPAKAAKQQQRDRVYLLEDRGGELGRGAVFPAQTPVQNYNYDKHSGHLW